MDEFIKNQEKIFTNMKKNKKYSEGLEYFKKVNAKNLKDKIYKNKFIAYFEFELQKYDEVVNTCNLNIKMFKEKEIKDEYVLKFDVYHIKILSLISLKKYKSSLKSISQLNIFLEKLSLYGINSNRAFSIIYSLKARCLFSLKKYNDSICNSNLAIKFNEDNYDAYTTKIISLYFKGEIEKCKKELKYLIDLNKENKKRLFDIYMMKGLMEGSIRDYSSSSVSLQKAERLSRKMDNKSKVYVLIHLSSALLNNEEYNKALFIINSIKRYSGNNKNIDNFIKFNKGIILSKKIKKLNFNLNSTDKYNRLLDLIKIGELDEKSEPASITDAKANIYYSYIKKYKNINNIKKISLDLFGKNLNVSLGNLTDLIRLVKFVYEFIISRKINSNKANSKYYQYTNSKILEPILDVNNNGSEFNLRLYNASYMNDSKEGKRLLVDICHNLGNGGKYLSYMLNNNIFNDNVYIASLSGIDPVNNNNSMPLWNNYGDDHKGIVMSLNITNTNNFDSKIPWDSDLIQKETNDYDNVSLNEFYSRKIKTDAYKVVYSETCEGQELVDKLSQIILSLNDCLKDDDIYEIVSSYINKVKYLYKNSIYSYEKEIRIIKEEKDPEKLHHDNGNPKLYTCLTDEDNLGISLAGITFGVNFDKPYLWYPLIFQKMGNEFEVNLSKMDYR